MASTSGELVLERLQKQVVSEGCPIKSACSRVTNLICGSEKDESGRVMLGMLPALLNVLFGDPKHPEKGDAWMERVRDRDSADALFDLLSPRGQLFNLLLRHSEEENGGRRPAFQIPVGPMDASLPVPILEALLVGGLGAEKKLPVPFNEVVHRTSLSDPPFTLGLGKFKTLDASLSLTVIKRRGRALYP